jgi:two-component system, LuxR family, response regulator FixJ
MINPSSQFNRFKTPITVDEQELAARSAQGRVILVDDDRDVVLGLSNLLHLKGYACETYNSASEYLDVLALNQPQFSGPCCVICDVKMPSIDGLELQRRLIGLQDMPVLLMSGKSSANEVVEAFRAGVVDFLIKPIEADCLLAAVNKALGKHLECQSQKAKQSDLLSRINSLSDREREIIRRVASGELNREIASSLGIGLRTIKLYRHRAMEKLGVDKLVDLVRLVDQGDL